jgi:hypothetical protein
MNLILKLGAPILLLIAAGCANESNIVVWGVRFDRERLSHGQQL